MGKGRPWGYKQGRGEEERARVHWEIVEENRKWKNSKSEREKE